MPDIICCGNSRLTPYCPMCGKQLRDHSKLDSLLRHLEARFRAADRLHKKMANEKTLLPRHAVNLEKWAAWRDELAEAIRRA